MNNYSKIYWFTRLDNLNTFLIGAALFFFVLVFIWLMWAYVFSDKMLVNKDEEIEIDARRKTVTKRAKIFIPIGFLFLLISAFIPTKNEVLLIMTGGKALDFVQSDTSLSKIPSQTTSIISQFLEKQLKELKSEKK